MQLQCGILAVSLFAATAMAATQNGPERMLNNEGLVVLARAGYNERFLVELIQSQPHRFDTSVEGLVYLAKQGISEKLVRLVIAEQKAAARRESEGATSDFDEPVRPAAAPKTPVRMKVIMQKVLVPVSPSEAAIESNPVIIVEKRAFGDRYYAMPGAQAPLATPVVTRRAPKSEPVATTQVAAFH